MLSVYLIFSIFCVFCYFNEAVLAQGCISLSKCRLVCSHGYLIDHMGCQVCQCAEISQVPVQCLNKHCHNFCPNGYIYDDRGCRTCECNKGILFGLDKCQKVYCPNKCPYNLYKNDEFGCKTCLCRVTKPDQKIQTLTTFNAGDRKESASTVSKCKQMTGCDLFCINGYVTDQFGCVTCRCKKEHIPVTGVTSKPTFALDTKQNATAYRCPTERCHRQCATGYIYNSKGCKTCQCNLGSLFVKERCQQVYCLNYCPYNLYAKDWNGCKTCRCQKTDNLKLHNYQNEHRTSRGTEGSRRHCPRLSGCDLFCSHGYVKDRNGCTHCECNKPLKIVKNYRPYQPRRPNLYNKNNNNLRDILVHLLTRRMWAEFELI